MSDTTVSDQGCDHCPTCRPEVAPASLGAVEPVDEGHWAFRFLPPTRAGKIAFYLDGVDVTYGCIEACASEGWAELAQVADDGRFIFHADPDCSSHTPYVDDPPPCDCHFATWIAYGRVAIRPRRRPDD